MQLVDEGETEIVQQNDGVIVQRGKCLGSIPRHLRHTCRLDNPHNHRQLRQARQRRQRCLGQQQPRAAVQMVPKVQVMRTRPCLLPQRLMTKTWRHSARCRTHLL